MTDVYARAVEAAQGLAEIVTGLANAGLLGHGPDATVPAICNVVREHYAKLPGPDYRRLHVLAPILSALRDTRVTVPIDIAALIHKAERRGMLGKEPQ